MFTPGLLEPALPMVSTLGPWGWGLGAHVEVLGTPASATWAANGRAFYFPLSIPSRCVAKRMWWANGATTTGGATIEAGLYQDAGSKPGSKLVSGSATQGTASQVQFVDITDTTLYPGLYWVALMSTITTNTTVFRVSFGAAGDAARFFEQTANPLPATATPVEAANSLIWLCGFSTTTIT